MYSDYLPGFCELLSPPYRSDTGLKMSSVISVVLKREKLLALQWTSWAVLPASG